jgi:nucleoside-diphosphate-sugar epimerase
LPTAFVTGAAGFVGLNLVEQLLAAGWRVVAMHRPPTDLKYLSRLPVERAVGDLTKPGSLLAAMPEAVDVVFHVAANLNMWSRRNLEQWRDNVAGTRNLVETALQRRAGRLVHTSSISAYGQQRGRIDEDALQLGEGSWINYQFTKFGAEEAVRDGLAMGLDAVILNPANIVGPYDRNGWARLIRLVHAGRLPGVPPGANSFCHVREVAAAHVAAAERGGTGENYLLGGTDASFLEAVRVIAEVTGREPPARVTPAFVLHTVGHLSAWLSYLTGAEPRITPEMAGIVCRHLFCDSSKAERDLDYRPVPLRPMIEESFRWLTAEGELETPTR